MSYVHPLAMPMLVKIWSHLILSWRCWTHLHTHTHFLFLIPPPTHTHSHSQLLTLSSIHTHTATNTHILLDERTHTHTHTNTHTHTRTLSHSRHLFMNLFGAWLYFCIQEQYSNDVNVKIGWISPTVWNMVFISNGVW